MVSGSILEQFNAGTGTGTQAQNLLSHSESGEVSNYDSLNEFNSQGNIYQVTNIHLNTK